ncbi:tetratricopeptide repeat protein [Clostridium uliginosum]|uniref:Tetratricopeptide repeat-containing protein n=1 Tax=Clostridium uliginosum TaxID=119641 RepID=A0A1I1K9Z6_9CLOT|nr:tetratricopeptide repeat protein [Clostridium uliginosum]SFC57737.1 Tetratricopeptide repeat-containing protein [Clostridium uliginosum]
MEKTKKNSFLQRISNKYKDICKTHKYLSSIITIALSLTVAMGIILVTKSSMSSNKTVTIATNIAEEAFYNKNYESAIEEYQKIQKETSWPFSNMKIAEIYSVKGDYVKSNEILSKVYEARNKAIDSKNKQDLKEQDKELINYIVFTYFMNGESKKALEYGELFLKDYPEDKNLLKTMFTIYMTNNDKEKAKKIIDNYPMQDISSSDLAILARMNMLVDNWNNGLKLLKDAWDKDKDEIMVFDVVEQIASYNKNEFIKRVSELEKKNPDECVYKMWMAKVYSMNKEYAQKSEEIIKNIENKDVGKINIDLIQYKAYENMGKEEEAKKTLKEIVSNNPESFIECYIASLYDYKIEDYKDALTYCKKSILINRDYSNSYSLIADIIVKQTNIKEVNGAEDKNGKKEKGDSAEPYFRTALYKELFNSTTMTKIAGYYSNIIKDSNKALEYYNMASQINPNDAEAYYNMALINLNNQREDKAVELLNKSIKLDNKSAKYYRKLGEIYLNKGKNEEAIKAIRSSYGIDKNDILTLNNAGCYYISVEGDVDRAMANFKSAYEGINDKTDNKTKEIITDNYNRLKNHNKSDKTTLTVSQFKLVQ